MLRVINPATASNAHLLAAIIQLCELDHRVAVLIGIRIDPIGIKY